MPCPRLLLWLAAAAACLVGAVGVIALPSGALVGWLGLGTLVGLLTLFGADQSAGEGHAGHATSATRLGVLAGAATVAGCIIVVGLIALFGSAVGLFLAVLVAAAGLARWRQLSSVGAEDDPAGSFGVCSPAATAPPTDSVRSAAPVPANPVRPGAPVPVVLGTFTEMSTEALCMAWRQSDWALQESAPGPERGRIVAVRSALLDELERRDEQGFSRWLNTDARAGGDPGPYLAAGG